MEILDSQAFTELVVLLWNIWNRSNLQAHYEKVPPTWLTIINAKNLQENFQAARVVTSMRQDNRIHGHQWKKPTGTKIKVITNVSDASRAEAFKCLEAILLQLIVDEQMLSFKAMRLTGVLAKSGHLKSELFKAWCVGPSKKSHWKLNSVAVKMRICITLGDCNTKYFHGNNKQRQPKNRISSVIVSDGEWCHGKDTLKVKVEAVKFFKTIYSMDAFRCVFSTKFIP
ncbi:hypothetical protein V6N11_079268 [Hibiscus sabdariffa]|uniref:Uncharacterized protein n=1 Tax=Hibiscus sabdariffa TaxID=183260 RepID=A0ABR2RVK5_9ROSI